MSLGVELMKKFKKAALIFTLAAGVTCFITGCTEKEIVKAQSSALEPDFKIKDNIVIDWEQAKEECQDALSKENYPQGDYIDVDIRRAESQKIIRLIWVLSDDANQLEALQYGPAFIKAFNDAVAVQDFSIQSSNENYYGGLWDRYALELEIFRASDIMEPDNYYVNQAMDAGSNDPVIPIIRGQNSGNTSSEESSKSN